MSQTQSANEITHQNGVKKQPTLCVNIEDYITYKPHELE